MTGKIVPWIFLSCFFLDIADRKTPSHMCAWAVLYGEQRLSKEEVWLLSELFQGHSLVGLDTRQKSSLPSYIWMLGCWQAATMNQVEGIWHTLNTSNVPTSKQGKRHEYSSWLLYRSYRNVGFVRVSSCHVLGLSAPWGTIASDWHLYSPGTTTVNYKGPYDNDDYFRSVPQIFTLALFWHTEARNEVASKRQLLFLVGA